MSGAYKDKFDDSPPKNRMIVTRAKIDEASWSKLNREVTEHPFNYSVEVFLPHMKTLPPSLLSLEDSTYYFKLWGSPLFLLSAAFITLLNSFPGVCLLSLNKKIDESHVFSISAPGRLLLSLQKDEYELFGIQGKKSQFSNETRHVIEVLLVQDGFLESKTRSRMCQAFSTYLSAPEHFILASPMPIEEHALQSLGIKSFEKVAPSVVSTVTEDLLFAFPIEMHSMALNFDLFASFQEYLGLLSRNISVGGLADADPFVAQMGYLVPLCDQAASMYYHRWEGMVHSSLISTIAQKLSKVLDSEEGGEAPWVAIHVSGFCDAPISFRGKAHSYLLNGENDYLLIILKERISYFVQYLGAFDATD